MSKICSWHTAVLVDSHLLRAIRINAIIMMNLYQYSYDNEEKSPWLLVIYLEDNNRVERYFATFDEAKTEYYNLCEMIEREDRKVK